MTVNFDLIYYAYKNCIFNIQLKTILESLSKLKLDVTYCFFYLNLLHTLKTFVFSHKFHYLKTILAGK